MATVEHLHMGEAIVHHCERAEWQSWMDQVGVQFTISLEDFWELVFCEVFRLES